MEQGQPKIFEKFLAFVSILMLFVFSIIIIVNVIRSEEKKPLATTPSGELPFPINENSIPFPVGDTSNRMPEKDIAWLSEETKDISRLEEALKIKFKEYINQPGWILIKIKDRNFSNPFEPIQDQSFYPNYDRSMWIYREENTKLAAFYRIDSLPDGTIIGVQSASGGSKWEEMNTSLLSAVDLTETSYLEIFEKINSGDEAIFFNIFYETLEDRRIVKVTYLESLPAGIQYEGAEKILVDIRETAVYDWETGCLIHYDFVATFADGTQQTISRGFYEFIGEPDLPLDLLDVMKPIVLESNKNLSKTGK